MASLALSLLLSIGCSENLDLAVDLRTDLVPGVEFDAIAVTVDGALAPLVAAPLRATVERGVRIHETRLSPGRHSVNVTLTLGGAPVVGRNYAIQLDRGLIFAAILTRDCRGVECPGAAGSVTDSECLAGRCVDPACDEPGGSACPPAFVPDCALDTDCDSTIACVTPICASGVCLQVSELGACATAEYCDPELGCSPIPVSTDAGVRDAGVLDAAPIPTDAGCTAASCNDGIACTTDLCAAGTCSHTLDDAPCGSSATCDPTAFGADPATGCVATGACAGRAAGFECRPASGDCDVSETCDGTNPECPANEFLPGTMSCRVAAGMCDVAEMCSGTSAECPADAFSSGVCRPAVGLCDQAESCTGASASCPADLFSLSGTVCRPAAGVCDQAELCSGSSGACPTNVFLSGSARCRDPLESCDAPEFCGGGAACPAEPVLDLRRIATTSSTRTIDPILVDLNGDGSPELIETRGDAEIRVWRGAPDGTFSSPSAYDYPNEVSGMAVGDIDQDGTLDLLCSAGPEVLIRSGNGSGAFGLIVPGSPVESAFGALAVADLDSDGRVNDVAVLTLATRELVLYFGSATLRLTEMERHLVGMRDALVAGDVDADGRIEIVVTGDRALNYLRHVSALRFSLGADQAIAGYPSHLALRNLDCSTQQDVVMDDRTSGGVRALRFGVTGDFTVLASLSSARTNGVDAGDINGDGVVDLVVLESGQGLVVYFGAGNRTWMDGMRFTDATANQGLVVADLDRDGHADPVFGSTAGVHSIFR